MYNTRYFKTIVNKVVFIFSVPAVIPAPKTNSSAEDLLLSGVPGNALFRGPFGGVGETIPPRLKTRKVYIRLRAHAVITGMVAAVVAHSEHSRHVLSREKKHGGYAILCYTPRKLLMWRRTNDKVLNFLSFSLS